jgi:hypothetical protein
LTESPKLLDLVRARLRLDRDEVLVVSESRRCPSLCANWQSRKFAPKVRVVVDFLAKHFA